MKYCPVCDRKYDDEMRVCGRDGSPLKALAGGDTVLDAIAGRMIKGRYEVIRKIGEGGMGTVYLAEQVSIGRKVALKLLRGSYAKNDEFVARFRREARLAASLNHRNIVTIHDFDQDSDDTLFIAMEYVDGNKLTDIIRTQGPLDIGRAVLIGSQIAEGLEAAHRQGVIHRDIKPDNIMVIGGEDAEEVKLMDFGIARLRDAGSMSHLTQTGMIMGTPAYMAPEQAEGAEVSERTDVYALGIVLYEMLSGTIPFKASTPGALLVKQMQEVPIALRRLRRELPPEVERAVMRALEKKPENRQRNMREVVQQLNQAGKNIDLQEAAVKPFGSTFNNTVTEMSRTIATTKILQGQFLYNLKRFNKTYLSLSILGSFLIAGLVFGVVKFMPTSAVEKTTKDPVVEETTEEASKIVDPVNEPAPASPFRADPDPKEDRSPPAPARPPAEKPKSIEVEPVAKPPSRADPKQDRSPPTPSRPVAEKPKSIEKVKKHPEVEAFTPLEKNIRDAPPTVATPAKIIDPANSMKIQDHIKLARSLRERGQYADAVAELAKARTLDPKDAQVQAELEKTRKACAAEKQIVGDSSLRC